MFSVFERELVVVVSRFDFVLCHTNVGPYVTRGCDSDYDSDSDASEKPWSLFRVEDPRSYCFIMVTVPIHDPTIKTSFF